MAEIYLDNAASTRVAPEVVEAMLPYLSEIYGNASSLHEQGSRSRTATERARATIAASINAKPREIIFTSGGTESNNFALKGVAFANRQKGNHIITTKVEHKCVMKACEWLATQGFEITYLDVDKEGFVDPRVLEAAITPKTILVSIIHGNNEIGTVQDLEPLGAVCAKRNIPFHTDACQSFTKVPIDVKKANVSLLTINSHKIHGPKGVGALYVKTGVVITPLLHGGDHEFHLRAGTENVPGIVGFGKAAELTDSAHVARMAKLRDLLIGGVLAIHGTRLNGSRTNRLCNNANFSFNGIEGEAIVGRLDAEGIRCSTGSACSETTLEPSYVLKAIGLTDEEANGSLRLTLSGETTEADVRRVLAVLPDIAEQLRAISPVGKSTSFTPATGQMPRKVIHHVQ